uniref:Putative secreted protein n=1 Tax=Anopheles marajoara TaxID=58244 RepID=A0A2M4C900_9DIPT
MLPKERGCRLIAQLPLLLIWTLSSGRRHTVRWSNVYVHKVPDGELGLGERFRIVRPFLAGTGDADFAHPERGSPVRVDDGEIKIGTLAARLRIHVPYQRRQFA